MKKSKKKFFRNLSNMQKGTILFATALLILFTLPIVMVLLVGLLPTITVLITTPKNHDKLTIIGCFNLAGVFIYILNITGNYSISGAIGILGNIFNLVIMLGSAAIGMLLYAELPNLFASIYKASMQHRLKTIEAKMEKFREDWGSEAIEREESAAKRAV